MDIKDLRFSIVFAVILVLEVIGEMMEFVPLIYVFKPLIAASLIWKVRSEPTDKPAVQNIMTFALLAALAGDVFLMIRGMDLFIYGLGMFLIAQIAIGISFWYWNQPRQKSAPFFDIILSAPFFMFFLVNVIYLTNKLREANLEDLVNPIWIYGGAITFMGISAVTRYHRADKNSYFWGLVGAILFLMSDTILAYDRFSEPIPNSSFYVMATYGIALFTIAMSTVFFLRYKRTDDEV
jgi:uncharacterized membrane protein YhhN